MDIKNLISTIVAVLSVVIGAVNAYLQSIGTGEINYFQLAVFIALAVLGWFQGRNANGSKKTSVQVADQTKIAENTK